MKYSLCSKTNNPLKWRFSGHFLSDLVIRILWMEPTRGKLWFQFLPRRYFASENRRKDLGSGLIRWKSNLYVIISVGPRYSPCSCGGQKISRLDCSLLTSGMSSIRTNFYLQRLLSQPIFILAEFNQDRNLYQSNLISPRFIWTWFNPDRVLSGSSIIWAKCDMDQV